MNKNLSRSIFLDSNRIVLHFKIIICLALGAGSVLKKQTVMTIKNIILLTRVSLIFPSVKYQAMYSIWVVTAVDQFKA